MRKRLIPLVLLLTNCQKEVPQVKSVTPVKVKVAEFEMVTTETRYSANIVPNTQVTVSFRVGGYVDKLMQVRGHDVEPVCGWRCAGGDRGSQSSER